MRGDSPEEGDAEDDGDGGMYESTVNLDIEEEVGDRDDQAAVDAAAEEPQESHPLPYAASHPLPYAATQQPKKKLFKRKLRMSIRQYWTI